MRTYVPIVHLQRQGVGIYFLELSYTLGELTVTADYVLLGANASLGSIRVNFFMS